MIDTNNLKCKLSLELNINGIIVINLTDKSVVLVVIPLDLYKDEYIDKIQKILPSQFIKEKETDLDMSFDDSKYNKYKALWFKTVN